MTWTTFLLFLFMFVTHAYENEKPLKPCQALQETSHLSSLFVRLLSRRLTFALLGAHDGVANDHAYKLAVRHRWSGVALEPHFLHYNTALKTYRAAELDVDVIHSAACTERAEGCVFTQDLARQYAPDLLISDVEGIDDQIVGSWLAVQKPKYIIAEIKNLVRVDEFLDELRDLGYCVRDDKHDVYAILNDDLIN